MLATGSLPAGRAATRYVFQSYGAAQGLGNQVVTALRRDRAGFLWVGTENGLYRYDGHRFLLFSTADGLPGESITGLHEAPDGTLFVGTTHGLAWRRGIRFAASPNDALGGVTFTQGVAADAQGNLYLTTTKGLARAKLRADGADVQLEMLPPPPGGAKNARITSVWVDPEGAVWFGCGLSVCRFSEGKVQVWGEGEGVPADGWQYLLKDHAGNLWARSRVWLIELPAGAQRFHTISPADAGALHFGFPGLALDHEGTLLVPTDSGLSMLRGGTWTRAGHRQGLAGGTVTAALFDGDSMWLGTTGGLARWTGYGKWESFTESEGLASGANLALIEDASGGLWAGSGGGLSHGVRRGGEWQWSAINDRSLNWVVNLALAPDGAIWLSTVEPQAVRFDPRTGKSQRFGKFDGPPYFLLVDSPGNLWVVRTNALFRGSAKLPAGTFEQVRPPGSTASTVFTRAAEDAQGNLWFGSFSGLFRLSHGKWFYYQKSEGLAGTKIFNVQASAAGDVLVRYRDVGEIDRVRADGDGVRVEHIDRSRGLEGDLVYVMRTDREGRLWALTDHGAAVRVGKQWVHYTEEDGLLWNDCNTFLAGSDGSIWIGSERGVSRLLAPAPVVRPPPAVTFSEARLGDRAGDSATPLVEPQPEPFLARFTVLDLAHASQAQYRYRVLGLDNRWVETTRPEVSFDYLRPGRYRLEVQARWPAAEWSAPVVALFLEVKPEWFEALWFEALIVAGVWGAIWIAWKLRTRYEAAARARLQFEVDVRTKELRLRNDQLRDEMAERERASRERQRLEEELLQAKKLESIGRLAGGVAHDFNNLLTVINGHCELILERLHEVDPMRTSVLEVRSAGQRAADLTRRLLAFSRKQMLQPSPISLADTVRGIEVLLRRLTRADIDLRFELAADSGMVMADRGQIEQAIINLVVNACDAIAGSGRILIMVGAVDVPEGAPPPGPDCGPGSYVMLSVADTGYGMDEETLKHVFEPFFTTKEVGKGTGLGLAMVHGVVKQSGGSIAAESRPGTGTTFRIYLPRIAAGGELAVSAETVSPRRVKGHESILLVEDQEQVRELAVAVLRHAGYSVDSAADGQSAMMLVEKLSLPVDLLLTDVVMPLMSGPELASQIRGRSPETRVLYISGYTTESLAADGVGEIQAQYLSKPFTPAQLLDKVRSALDQVS